MADCRVRTPSSNRNTANQRFDSSLILVQLFIYADGVTTDLGADNPEGNRDGTTPTTSSPVYGGTAITLSSTETLKADALAPGSRAQPCALRAIR